MNLETNVAQNILLGKRVLKFCCLCHFLSFSYLLNYNYSVFVFIDLLFIIFFIVIFFYHFMCDFIIYIFSFIGLLLCFSISSKDSIKRFSGLKPLMANVLHHIETSQLIWIANQLTGFDMMGSIGL